MTVRPDEADAREAVAGGPFRLGLALGRWRDVRLDWPHLIVDIAAAPRPDAPDVYTLRVDLSGYPAQAPLGEFWDPVANAKLPANQWPSGAPGSRPEAILRPDWAAGHHGLYAAFDRSGISTHPDWRQQHPSEAWTPQRTLTDYLESVHDLLASPDYAGTRRPQPSALL